MSAKMIVLVDDDEAETGASISVFDTVEQAERLVESLLEAGYSTAQIRIFAATPNGFATRYRPVVSFEGADQGPALSTKRGQAPAASPGPDERRSSPLESPRDKRVLTACEAAA